MSRCHIIRIPNWTCDYPKSTLYLTDGAGWTNLEKDAASFSCVCQARQRIKEWLKAREASKNRLAQRPCRHTQYSYADSTIGLFFPANEADDIGGCC